MDKTFNIQKVTQALGIPDALFNKWSEKAIVMKKTDDDDPIFQLNGPIVSDGMYSALGEPEGLVSPSSLLGFLNAHKNQDIMIDINTPGGDVHSANAMLVHLMRAKGDVTLNVIGTAYSAGASFLTLENAHRAAYSHADIMIHRAWTLAIGNADDLRSVVDDLERTDRNIAKRFARVSEYDQDEIMEMMAAETFMDAVAARDAGFIDEIIDEDVAVEDDEMEDADDEKTMIVEKSQSMINAEKAMSVLFSLPTKRV